MNEITVFLFDYSNGQTLQKALYSLISLKHRIKTVYLLNPPTPFEPKAITDHVQAIFVPKKKLSDTLNALLQRCDSTYALFLQNNDTLSQSIRSKDLTLSASQSVMTINLQTGNHFMQYPFFTKTALFQKKKLLDITQLPFPEALFPAWLQTVEKDLILQAKQEFIKRPRTKSSKSQREKDQFLKKYEHTKADLTSPSLAIIMSTYNMADYIETAIASCFLQQTQPDQVLVIDDGSEDDSYKKMLKWKEQERVTLLRKKNSGKARALNELLPYVTADFVMEVDADDWLDPDALFLIKKKLQRLPKDVSVLYGNFRKWKQQPTDGLMYKGIAKGKTVKTERELASYRFPLGPRVYRTAALKRVGGFPLSPFENGRLYEDVSVLINLIKQSKISYDDFTVYNIREHTDSITRKNRHKWKEFKPFLKYD